MSVTWEDLRDYINGGSQDELEQCLTTALALLEPVFEQAYRPIPEAVQDQVTKEVASAVLKRREAPTGQFATAEGTVNVPRDPLALSWPTLRRYVGWF